MRIFCVLGGFCSFLGSLGELFSSLLKRLGSFRKFVGIRHRLLCGLFQGFLCLRQFLLSLGFRLVGLFLYLRNILPCHFLGGLGDLFGQFLRQLALGQFGQILRLLRGFFSILFGSLSSFFLLWLFCVLGGFGSLLRDLGKLLCGLLKRLGRFFQVLVLIGYSLRRLLGRFLQRLLCLLQRLAGIRLGFTSLFLQLRDVLLGQFLGGFG